MGAQVYLLGGIEDDTPLAQVLRIALIAHHSGGNPGPNLGSISHRCHPMLVEFVWQLTKQIIDWPVC